MTPHLPDPRPTFQYGARLEIVVGAYERVALSIPALAQRASLEAKDLLTPVATGAEGKYTLEEHLSYLAAAGAIRPERPLLVLGARNNLVNLRAPVILEGRPHAVAGEDPVRSQRPYYGLGLRGGRLVVDRALGPEGRPDDWPGFFCAGVPTLWDGLEDAALLEIMLTEAADHAHLFDLPRGGHPRSTEATRSVWMRLHEAFVATLLADAATAGRAMQAALAACRPPLARCDDFLHSVLGVSDDGALVGVFAHGRLEHIGRLAGRHGCRRAVCLENSGSVMPTYLPYGLGGDRIPLLRAPNFRPRGRAVLVLELAERGFEALPLTASPTGSAGGDRSW